MKRTRDRMTKRKAAKADEVGGIEAPAVIPADDDCGRTGTDVPDNTMEVGC